MATVTQYEIDVASWLAAFGHMSFREVAEHIVNCEMNQNDVVSDAYDSGKRDAEELVSAELADVRHALRASLSIRRGQQDAISTLEKRCKALTEANAAMVEEAAKRPFNPMPRGILTDTEILNATLETLRELSRQIERSTK